MGLLVDGSWWPHLYFSLFPNIMTCFHLVDFATINDTGGAQQVASKLDRFLVT